MPDIDFNEGLDEGCDDGDLAEIQDTIELLERDQFDNEEREGIIQDLEDFS